MASSGLQMVSRRRMKQVHAIAIGSPAQGARVQVRARVVMSTLSTVAGVAGALAPVQTAEVDQSKSRDSPHWG